MLHAAWSGGRRWKLIITLSAKRGKTARSQQPDYNSYNKINPKSWRHNSVCWLSEELFSSNKAATCVQILTETFPSGWFLLANIEPFSPMIKYYPLNFPAVYLLITTYYNNHIQKHIYIYKAEKEKNSPFIFVSFGHIRSGETPPKVMKSQQIACCWVMVWCNSTSQLNTRMTKQKSSCWSSLGETR